MKWIICAAAAAFCALPAASFAQETTTHVIQMTAASGVLTKTLDAKKTKQDDPVMIKLDKEVKLDGGATLPKDTLLAGKVDQVQMSENKGQSTIEITLDHAQMKDGKTVPVKATVVQIARPLNVMGISQQGNNPNSAGPMPAPSPSGAGPGNAQPGAMPNPGAMPVQVKDESGYHGVTLKSDIHDKTSGTFSDQKRNVHLSSGTRLELAIAPALPDSSQ
ncbi:hypothetical protein [Acidipila rosea]|uniref:DUF5666 domain-containing protein n=1 Tax=Acidipila rosea TaxID=768535 RepID=A0A4R1L6A6_9BACT|nr:hypothetical protein [Acidipila rosea]TCK72590.1 hypothetical protein C7378_2175 [Acidipila rosea]